MRLALLLPPVQPEVYPAVETCPDTGCGGAFPALAERGQAAARHPTLRGGGPSLPLRPLWRTFRLYPTGVSHDQTSARLKGVAVMFSVLGMSTAR